MKIKAVHFKKAAINWYNNDPFEHSAAIAYYTIFSFPALGFIYLSLASLFASREQLQGQMMRYFGHILGKSSVENVQQIIEKTAPQYENWWALAGGFGILLFAGLKLFMELQKTLNTIWQVKVAKNISYWSLIKQRLISLSVMVAVGFVMLTSLMVTTMVAALSDYIEARFSEDLLIGIHAVNLIISLLVISVLFTILLKLLPDAEIEWKYAWVGGVITTIFFMMGEAVLGLYFDKLKPESAYGATGTIILLMLWVSYTCVILLFGAEITKVILEANKQKPAKANKVGAKRRSNPKNKD